MFVGKGMFQGNRNQQIYLVLWSRKNKTVFKKDKTHVNISQTTRFSIPSGNLVEVYMAMLVYQRVNLHFPMVFLWFSH